MLPPGEESVTIPAKAPYSIIVSPISLLFDVGLINCWEGVNAGTGDRSDPLVEHRVALFAFLSLSLSLEQAHEFCTIRK